MRYTTYLFEDVVCHACDGDILKGEDVFCAHADEEGDFFCSPRCFDDSFAPDPDDRRDER